MKKNIFKGILYTLLSFNLISCSDFLDVDPRSMVSDAAVWGNLGYAEAFLNNCYTYVEADNEQGVPFSSYTDEMFHRTGYATEVYTLGNVSPDNYNVGFSSGKGNTWEFYYSGISKVNQLLENIDKVPTSGSESDRKEEIIGQAYFLRAFLYHQLYSLYGRIPIVDHTFDLKSQWTETRADMDSVADFIAANCDSAVAHLPFKYASSDDFGRATKGAAMAVKARTLLYKASPLFGTPTAAKWKAAADANKEIIDLKDVYSLPQVKNSEEYAALFNNTQNSEIIFLKLYNKKGTYGNSLHYLFQAPTGPYNGYNGWGVWLPTYDSADTFQKSDGTKFEMTGMGSYNISLPSVDASTGQIVYEDVTITATKNSPWENRELRFYANILYDGAMWGYGDDNHAIGIFEPGERGVLPGEQSPSYTDGEYWNATQTGYYMRKFLDVNYDAYNESVVDVTPWIFFRLSEIYLNYAECMIELGDDTEALKYINLVRERAHQPKAQGLDIRSEYEYERKVELMFEGQRFFDLRRWKKMETAYSKENWPTGMKIYKLADGTLLYNHNTNYLQQRKFVSPQMYWMPVPRYELNKSPNIDGLPYED